jgi:hypothetical protein
MKTSVSAVGCMPLLCLARLICASPRHPSILIRKLPACNLIIVSAYGRVTPDVKSIADSSLDLDVSQEILEVIKDKSIRRARPAIMPMLQNDRPFLFERLANDLNVLGGENLPPVG